MTDKDDAYIKSKYYETGYKDGQDMAYEAMFELLKNQELRRFVLSLIDKEIKPENLQSEVDKHMRDIHEY